MGVASALKESELYAFDSDALHRIMMASTGTAGPLTSEGGLFRVVSPTAHEFVYRLAGVLYGRANRIVMQRDSVLAFWRVPNDDKDDLCELIFEGQCEPDFARDTIAAHLKLELRDMLRMDRMGESSVEVGRPSVAESSGAALPADATAEASAANLGKNVERDAWMYDQATDGVSNKAIIKRLAEDHPDWEPIERLQSVTAALRRHAKRNELGWPIQGRG